MRFGPKKDQEKPRPIDESGAIRDLSAHVPDISGSETLTPEWLTRAARQSTPVSPLAPEGVRLERLSIAPGTFIAIGFELRRPCQGSRPRDPVSAPPAP